MNSARRRDWTRLLLFGSVAGMALSLAVVAHPGLSTTGAAGSRPEVGSAMGAPSGSPRPRPSAVPALGGGAGSGLVKLPASLAPLVRRTLARRVAAQYAIWHGPSGYRAANAVQRLEITFTPHGPRLSPAPAGSLTGRPGHPSAPWTWGMILLAIGGRHAGQAGVGHLAAKGDLFSYRRAGAVEWYRNEPSGLEQGFVVRHRPAGIGRGRLVISLHLSGSLYPHLESGHAVSLTDASGRPVLRYAGLSARDARGRSLAASIGLRGRTLSLLIQSGAARYPIQVDPSVEQTQTLPPFSNFDTGTGAPGSSVALDAAGDVALVGASAQNAVGAAEVYTRSDGRWEWTAELTVPPSPSDEDQLGASVALSANGQEALVGAPGRQVRSTANAGAAEIFSDAGGSWTLVHELSLGSSAASGDGFGTSVALSGDGDTALIGSPGRDVSSMAGMGEAEVFTFSNGAWSSATPLDATDPNTLSLGESVALSSDGTTALAGADETTVNGESLAGAADVFTFNGSAWSAPAELDLGSQAGTDDELGASVALDGAGDEALVGAPLRTLDNIADSGAAEVFTLDLGAWTHSTELTPGSTAESDAYFGSSVALSGDGKTALASSPNHVNTSDRGIAQIFTLTAGTWSPSTELDLGSNAGPAQDQLGYSVALDSAADTALLGAIDRSVDGGIGSGAAEVFTSSSGTWTYAQELNLWFGDGFGASLALSADGDTALVGMPDRNLYGEIDAGDAFLYTFSDGSWHGPTELNLGAAGSAAGDLLGASVALDPVGDMALVGAPGRQVSSTADAGAVEVFTLSAGVWSRTAELTLASPQGGDALGASVALQGAQGNATALVGAPGRAVTTVDGPQHGAGEADVFTLSGGTWSGPTALNLGNEAAPGDALGTSVALDNDGQTALVGAPGRTITNGGGPQEGAGEAEVFTFSNSSWSGPSSLNLGDLAAAGDSLGASVALSSNGETALAGVPYRTVQGHADAGAGEIFTYDGSTWSGPTQLDLGPNSSNSPNGPGSETNALLGYSVALTTDGKTALMGAPSGCPPSLATSVYACAATPTPFSTSTNSTAGTPRSKADRAPTQRTGAIRPDGHGSGGNTIPPGMVEVFEQNGDVWDLSTTAAFSADSSQPTADVGTSVAVAGDALTVLAGAAEPPVIASASVPTGAFYTFSVTPTGSAYARLRVRISGRWTTLRWRSTRRVAGFDVYSGRLKLNRRLITSRTGRYTFRVHRIVRHPRLVAVSGE